MRERKIFGPLDGSKWKTPKGLGNITLTLEPLVLCDLQFAANWPGTVRGPVILLPSYTIAGQKGWCLRVGRRIPETNGETEQKRPFVALNNILLCTLWFLQIGLEGHPSCCLLCCSKLLLRDFPGGPVVKNQPSNTGDAGSIPGRETNIPHAVGQLSPCASTTEPAHSRAHAPQLDRSLRAAMKDPTCRSEDHACPN